MGSLFSAPKPPPPPPPPPPAPPPPTLEDPEIKRKKEEARLANIRRKGRGDTILTSGLGVVGDAPTDRKTLLGQ
jgi:hypothetical protein